MQANLLQQIFEGQVAVNLGGKSLLKAEFSRNIPTPSA